jgi:hypothetical protein
MVCLSASPWAGAAALGVKFKAVSGCSTLQGAERVVLADRLGRWRVRRRRRQCGCTVAWGGPPGKRVRRVLAGRRRIGGY